MTKSIATKILLLHKSLAKYSVWIPLPLRKPASGPCASMLPRRSFHFHHNHTLTYNFSHTLFHQQSTHAHIHFRVVFSAYNLNHKSATHTQMLEVLWVNLSNLKSNAMLHEITHIFLQVGPMVFTPSFNYWELLLQQILTARIVPAVYLQSQALFCIVVFHPPPVPASLKSPNWFSWPCARLSNSETSLEKSVWCCC